MKIEKLVVENFRGIRRLHLDTGGRNLIIVGENGSGKSSIIDALEYFFTGRLEKLTGRADVKARDSIPHLKGGPTRVYAEFSGGQQCSVPYPRRGFKTPAGLKGTFKMAQDHPFVLRRSQILDFINARPGDRYDEISKIVGLGELDKIDRMWRGKLRKAAAEVERLQGLLDEIFDALGETLITVIDSEQDLLNALDEWLLMGSLAPVKRRADIGERIRELREALRSHPQRETVAGLRQAQQEIETAKDKLAALLLRQEAMAAEAARYWRQHEETDDGAWERLLAEGRRVLQGSTELEMCPLCESPLEDGALFLKRLEERVEAAKALIELRRKIREEANALAGAVNAFSNDVAQLGDTLQQSAVPIDVGAVPQMKQALGQWQKALHGERFLAEAAPWGEHDSVERFRQVLQDAAEAVAQRLQGLEWDDALERLHELLLKLGVVDEQWQRLELAAERLAQAKYMHEQISSVYEELLDARIRGMDRLRQELEADFDRFYQMLHPNEGYEAISIAPQKDRRSSVDLTARFHQQDPAHPLGFWSEGHLDSLGLCVFLAFFSRYNNGFALIALDDVLTTVDAGHRLRVARLLAKEFAGQQIIITTHDQLWARQLQSVLPNNQMVTLKRWSYDRGADTQDNVLSDWDYYREQAQAGRPQDAIAGAGRNLEKFLYQMRGNLGLAVPARPNGDYSIGDLYPPFAHWARGHEVQRADRVAFAGELAQLLQELDEVWRLRNWVGAHFNEWAASVSAEEALSFVDVVRQLVACFECPVCGNLVIYNHGAKALICPSCEPQPPRRVTWQYDPQWVGRAQRLKGASHPERRKNLVKMSSAYFERFLQDMRRRAQLAVPARADEQYTAADLYRPLMLWARDNPLPEQANWTGDLQRRHKQLIAFRRDGEWYVADDAADAFCEAVQAFIALFACNDCAQLLNYDEKSGYWCGSCAREEEVEVGSAYWFVR